MKKNVGSKNNNNIIHPSNSNKKQINNAAISSNFTGLNHIKANVNLNSCKNPPTIYNNNFITLINQLSKIINTLYKSNNSNFAQMKNILENNNITDNNNISKNKNEKELNTEKNLSLVSNSFNQIETSFNDFYLNAKMLFEKMKQYENIITNDKENKENKDSKDTNKQRNSQFRSVESKKNYNDLIIIEDDFINGSNQRVNKNIVKINNNQNKKNKMPNRSSSTAMNYNNSVEKIDYKSGKKQKIPRNNNKLNLSSNPYNKFLILSNQKNENIYKDNDNDIDTNLNVDLIMEENKQLRNKNIMLEKKNKNLKELINSSKNSSSCNIRANNPTKIIMDNSLFLNDISIDKSFQVISDNSKSATHRNKKDLNKSFCSNKKNNYILSFKLSNLNNHINNKKNENKIKNYPIKIKTIKENVNQVKDRIFKHQNIYQNQIHNNNIETRNSVSKKIHKEV